MTSVSGTNPLPLLVNKDRVDIEFDDLVPTIGRETGHIGDHVGECLQIQRRLAPVPLEQGKGLELIEHGPGFFSAERRGQQ